MMEYLARIRQFRWSKIKTGYARVADQSLDGSQDRLSLDKNSVDGLLEKEGRYRTPLSREAFWKNPYFLIIGHLMLFSVYAVLLVMVSNSKCPNIRRDGLPFCKFCFLLELYLFLFSSANWGKTPK